MSKIILDTDPESAELVTVTLWKSATGNLYNEEGAARYDGCTHRACNECVEPVQKSYMLCDKCSDKKDIERYNNREKIVWDGNTPIYSEACEKYIFNEDDLNDLLCEHLEEDLRLRSCEPIYLSQIPEDYWCDDLAEDQDLPGEILAALQLFNDVISSHEPVSWMPGKYSVTL